MTWSGQLCINGVVEDEGLSHNVNRLIHMVFGRLLRVVRFCIGCICIVHLNAIACLLCVVLVAKKGSLFPQ